MHTWSHVAVKAESSRTTRDTPRSDSSPREDTQYRDPDTKLPEGYGEGLGGGRGGSQEGCWAGWDSDSRRGVGVVGEEEQQACGESEVPMPSTAAGYDYGGEKSKSGGGGTQKG